MNTIPAPRRTRCNKKSAPTPRQRLGARTRPLWRSRHKGALPFTIDDVRAELAERVLACWCPLDQPCHADVLLRIAYFAEVR